MIEMNEAGYPDIARIPPTVPNYAKMAKLVTARPDGRIRVILDSRGGRSMSEDRLQSVGLVLRKVSVD